MNAASIAPDWSGGPVWDIFQLFHGNERGLDAGAPRTDPLFFYQANDLPTLAQQINTNAYQVTPMSGATLQASVAQVQLLGQRRCQRHRLWKDAIKEPISTPPYYAAFAAPVVHDTLTGIHINTDRAGNRSWRERHPESCGTGESVGGFSMHGLGKCIVYGIIAEGAQRRKRPS